ncbi:MAG: hypothetical protein COB59_06570 [Rhodospirillaceae bacterium]|nr:MAG: hypothetical protein COB59_06570 [Rhodospirillaceae bacterium]
MKINVKKTQPQLYSVTLGNTVHTLGINDLKTLVLESVKVLAPGALPAPSIDIIINTLATRLHASKEADLQEFILHAPESELLLMLKSTETNTDLHKKMFENMSTRKHTILSEDLQYKFQNGIDGEMLNSAISKLSELADKYSL